MTAADLPPPDYIRQIRDQITGQRWMKLDGRLPARLPHVPEAEAALAQMDLHEVIAIYINWLLRHLPQEKRHLHLSDRIAPALAGLSMRQRAGYELVCERLASGGDLEPYLSRRVDRLWRPPLPERAGKPHPVLPLDGLLNDWGLHHLHLIAAHGRHRRHDAEDTPVLILAVRAGAAWLVDIVEHGIGHAAVWTDIALVETVLRNWPEAGLVHVLKQTDGCHWPELSAEEMRRLRDAGIPYELCVDGLVIQPEGMSASGVSGRLAHAVTALTRALRQLQAEAEAGEGPLVHWLGHVGLPGRPAEWQVAINASALVVWRPGSPRVTLMRWRP
ncbi:MAG TPA: hypothetical protein VFF98_10135 [Novosphingobium sp.]|nr:hypothetical protein [Novosphingobium sp.]